MTKRLITTSVTYTEEDDNNETLVYVKEFKKKMCMTERHAQKRNKERQDHRDIRYRLRKCRIFKKL